MGIPSAIRIAEHSVTNAIHTNKSKKRQFIGIWMVCHSENMVRKYILILWNKIRERNFKHLCVCLENVSRKMLTFAKQISWVVRLRNKRLKSWLRLHVLAKIRRNEKRLVRWRFYFACRMVRKPIDCAHTRSFHSHIIRTLIVWIKCLWLCQFQTYDQYKHYTPRFVWHILFKHQFTRLYDWGKQFDSTVSNN